MIKRSPGAGRKNEVGSDVAKPVRIPLSLMQSVKALVKLHRSRVACPQIYAAIAMGGVYEVLSSRLGSLPVWGAESTKITRYLNDLLLLMFKVYEVKDRNDEVDQMIDGLESVLEKLEYTICELALFRELSASIDLIEKIEKIVTPHYPLPIVR